MRAYGIARRTLSEAAAGDLNSQYVDGAHVGEAEHGYQRKGWNPWNRGKRKETDADEAVVAEKIRVAMQGHPCAFKPREEWDYGDCLTVTAGIASALRTREGGLYEPYLQVLGAGWVTEHFEEDFIFQRPRDGLWQGFIVDIAHPIRKIAVEVDGDYHESTWQIPLDADRDTRLRALGWRVFRVKTVEDVRDLIDTMGP